MPQYGLLVYGPKQKQGVKRNPLFIACLLVGAANRLKLRHLLSGNCEVKPREKLSCVSPVATGNDLPGPYRTPIGSSQRLPLRQAWISSLPAPNRQLVIAHEPACLGKQTRRGHGRSENVRDSLRKPVPKCAQYAHIPACSQLPKGPRNTRLTLGAMT